DINNEDKIKIEEDLHSINEASTFVQYGHPTLLNLQSHTDGHPTSVNLQSQTDGHTTSLTLQSHTDGHPTSLNLLSCTDGHLMHIKGQHLNTQRTDQSKEGRSSSAGSDKAEEGQFKTARPDQTETGQLGFTGPDQSEEGYLSLEGTHETKAHKAESSDSEEEISVTDVIMAPTSLISQRNKMALSTAGSALLEPGVDKTKNQGHASVVNESVSTICQPTVDYASKEDNIKSMERGVETSNSTKDNIFPVNTLPRSQMVSGSNEGIITVTGGNIPLPSAQGGCATHEEIITVTAANILLPSAQGDGATHEEIVTVTDA
ncbi:unnamed protein product, partial [Lymnaea stagnalis]